jgi:hypothetical protein
MFQMQYGYLHLRFFHLERIPRTQDNRQPILAASVQFPQLATFETLRKYARHRFVLMKLIHKNREINFPFPDMRTLNGRFYKFR